MKEKESIRQIEVTEQLIISGEFNHAVNNAFGT